MSGSPTSAAKLDAVERYVARIEAHLARLARGHDPWGHLFAIERLARGARGEWSDAHRPPERERQG